jgi:serine/threonine protein kinase
VSAGTEPTQGTPPLTGAEDTTLVWLNSLSSGLCTPEAFLRAMREQYQGDRDGHWEVLSRLDQYYRRGKIKPDIFQALKFCLEDSALNAGDDAAAAIRSHTSTSVTAPAVADRVTVELDARPAVQEVAVGDVLRGRYKVRGVLGHGGMGTVFEATDEYRLDVPGAGRRLAVKVLHTAVTQREELLSELQREFQHLQSLSHPNIVRVHEFDRDGDIAYFTMELLSGLLLSRVLAARNSIAFPRNYALTVIRDVGAALSHAHSRGVIHGDINPQNIFLTNDGEVRVLDFGASRKMILGPEVDLLHPAPVATPGYASCQLLEGQRPDARDDIFAFACVAYLLLSGRHPFPDRTALEARLQRLRPPRPRHLTGQQWRALRDGLRWERERRPSDVQKWLERFGLGAAAPHLPPLLELIKTPPSRKPALVRAAAAFFAVALLVAAAYWAVTNYDSLSSDVKGWIIQARTTLAGRDALPAAPPPPVVDEAAPLPAVTPAPAIQQPSPRPPSVAQAPPIATPAPTPRPRATAPKATPPEATSARPVSVGPSRLELAADTVEVQANDTAAHVIVRRKGNPHAEASFTWWTESGTAKPGRDFVPMTPRVEHIADGANSVALIIPLTSAVRTLSKSFYVVIDRTDSGPAVGARTLTMVTILPPD